MTGIHSFDLTGKRALITGAAGLLGREHAKALVEIGAEVVLTDINEKELLACQTSIEPSYSSRVKVAIMDVASEESIRQVASECGDIDVLINNAAIDAKLKKDDQEPIEFTRLENFPIGEWNRQIAVGLSGAFLCARIFGTEMAKRKSGVILNISSDLSVFAPDQRLYRKSGLDEDKQPVKPVTYSVIKTALIGLTRYLAGYWADHGVRVNAMSPGGVFNNHPEEFVQRLSDLIPMGRMAHLEEYRAAVQFLCTPASSYMTGQNIVIDGGRSIL
jgi:NAD(P)-dependent dehydrogenase (short-subunit alcohol dehydrogenase family)